MRKDKNVVGKEDRNITHMPMRDNRDNEDGNLANPKQRAA